MRGLRLGENNDSDKSTIVEGLSKNQLKAALIHLIEVSFDFCLCIHVILISINLFTQE